MKIVERTYPLFVGEVVSNNMTISFPPDLRNALETQCREEWRALHKLDHPNENASPHVPYDMWSKTEEGHVHEHLARCMFSIDTGEMGYPVKPYAIKLSVTDYNLAYSRLQAQRHNLHGKRKLFMDIANDSSQYRKFRSWWVSNHLAMALSVEFHEICPYKRPDIIPPTESYVDMLRHFEEYTGHKIAKELWKEYKIKEHERLTALAEQYKADLLAA